MEQLFHGEDLAKQKAQGLTANSLTSVSLDPPLVLVCIDHTVRCFQCFRRDRPFAVNILSKEQENVSRRFASKSEDKFEGLRHRPGRW
ncbi:MAG: flavin reductase family protein, partial [Dehalococcoidia bacterium]